MTQIVQVVCDACGRDLTYTGNAEAYRIVVSSQSIPNEPLGESSFAAVTLMHVVDPVPEPKHFCGTQCLRDWVAR